MQLIEEKTAGQPEVSVYTIKDKDTFLDFCVGPHVPSTGRLKAFKLTSTSNAYWKGDAKNAPMQRVYGTAFFSQKELDEHLTRIEEAKKRDHRKLGRELGPVSHPPGRTGRRVLDAARHDALQHARRVLPGTAEGGLPGDQDTAPLLEDAVGAVGALGQVPGEHVPGAEYETNEHDMSLKPMNCPSHHLYYGTAQRSYRELPLRLRDVRRRCTATSCRERCRD